MCFSARGERPGRFYVPSGNLAAIKLVHLYGYVTCATQNSNSWSYWGCWVPSVKYHVGVAITTSSSYQVILPLSRFIAPSGDSGLRLRKWSRIPGCTGLSSSLVLSFGDAPYYSSGETFRLWYGEDLVDSTERTTQVEHAAMFTGGSFNSDAHNLQSETARGFPK